MVVYTKYIGQRKLSEISNIMHPPEFYAVNVKGEMYYLFKLTDAGLTIICINPLNPKLHVLLYACI